jgi:glycosyltransferase involved in cell wall biosynthesis
VESSQPAVSVIVATRNRRARLKALIDSLRAQSLPAERFEVILVDDGSDDGTAELLRAERDRSDLELRFIRRRSQGGPGCARNDGWRAAAGPLVAFIDDDCVASPRWLEAGLEVCARNPGAIVQGRTEPDPAEEAAAGPFSYTIHVPKLSPYYETCNIFYPRSVLEALDGFDTEAFPGGGEDCDLAWRAIESGTDTVFAPQALAFHAVHDLGPLGHLKRAWHWTDTMLVFARHPALRKGHLRRRLFWKMEHYAFARVLLVPLIPRRLRLLRRWFVWRWLADLGLRGRLVAGPARGVLMVPYFVLHDVVEMLAVLRGAFRYRTPVA